MDSVDTVRYQREPDHIVSFFKPNIVHCKRTPGSRFLLTQAFFAIISDVNIPTNH